MDKHTPTFDYVIVGAGAAGLMLADTLGKDPYFKEKSILLLEKSTKNQNDRTWCFWEKGQGVFDDIVTKSWPCILFKGNNFSEAFKIAPYSYKMIKGASFYQQYLSRIKTYSNVIYKQAEVQGIKDAEGHVHLITDLGNFTGRNVFSSILDFEKLLNQNKYPVLQQHFVGWFVRAEAAIFDESTATFMDFSVPQKGNTRFMYVLPFSKNEALVEYTLFSESLLEIEAYENALINYLEKDLNCTNYEILDREKGSIPMTSYRFEKQNTPQLLHIGSAGGWTKASTGYTFKNTFHKTKALVRHLKKGKSLDTFHHRTRHWYYDLLLLDILKKKNHKGSLIFESMFKRRTPQEIFKFLDEKTTLIEELRIISACPKKDFIEALLRRLF